MEYAGFAQPSSALVTAAHIMHAPASEMAGHLSSALAEDVPHRAVALLATQCASSPVAAVGDQELTDTLTEAVLGALVAQITPGYPWQGTAHLSGPRGRSSPSRATSLPEAREWSWSSRTTLLFRRASS
ncbi:hypothetical protein [Actinoallomurus bryophytorum]|nr:hypothetical protein [Actinoallomurus bryophytorum]